MVSICVLSLFLLSILIESKVTNHKLTLDMSSLASACFPFVSLNISCLPYCPSGYSETSKKCIQTSTSILDSLFHPSLKPSLLSNWKNSEILNSIHLTESRGIYFSGEFLLKSTQSYSFGGFLRISLWVASFTQGWILRSPNFKVTKNKNGFSLIGNFISLPEYSTKKLRFFSQMNENWNFIYFDVKQANQEEVEIQSGRFKETFLRTLFFFGLAEIELGGFKGFLYKFGVYGIEQELENIDWVPCGIGEFLVKGNCFKCLNENQISECSLFKSTEKGYRRLSSCYTYSSLICLSSCPTGYTTGSSSCTLSASSYYLINFHSPNSASFSDSSETLTFTSSYSLNAYKRGIYLNSTYGNLIGSSVQISPDFQFFFYLFPKSLTGLILSKTTSPTFSIQFESGKLRIYLGSISILIGSSYFSIDTWVGIFIQSTSITSLLSTFSINIDLTSVYSLSSTLFEDVNSPWYISKTLTYNGYIYLMAYGPGLNFFQSSDFLTTSCSSSCGICLSSEDCLSVCDIDEYFDDSMNCYSCTDCENCIRDTSCSLNTDPLCEEYTDYESCNTCKDFSEKDSNGLCKCLSGMNYQDTGEICCSELCDECESSSIFCKTCQDFKFQDVCLSECPSLTENNGGFCESVDNDSKVSFSFDVTGNYVIDTSEDPISEVFGIDGSEKKLNPMLNGTDPMPGLGRGLYLNENTFSLSDFVLSPIHTWIVWAKLSSFGSILDKSEFSLYINSTALSFSYKAASIFQVTSDFTHSLNLGSWFFMYLSANIISSQTTISFTYNQEAIQQYSPDTNLYIIDYTGSLLLAKESLNGWIYKIEYLVYYVSTSDLNDYYDIISNLGSCGIKEYKDTDGFCKTCDSECIACVEQGTCLVCTDSSCYSCYSYDSTDCTKCLDSQVFLESLLQCTDCLLNCKTCWGIGKDSCYECANDFFMSAEGLCVQTCPSGFNSIYNECVSDGDRILSYKFNNITDPVIDSVHNFQLSLGDSSGYNPANDNTEPRFLTYRGLYFTNLCFANLSTSNPYLAVGNTHTFDFWIMPMEILQNGQVFALRSSSYSFFAVQLIPSAAAYTLNVSYMLESTTNNITLLLDFVTDSKNFNVWVRVSIQFEFTSIGCSVSLYLNGILESSQSEQDYFLSESLDSSFVIGKSITSSFTGYLYSLDIYTIIADLTTLDYCSCSVCDTEGCLIDCLEFEYWNGSSCENCNSECTLGCSRAENCVLHPDNLCETFQVLEKGSCEECVTLAQDTGNCTCINNSLPLSDYSSCTCDPDYNLFNNECIICYSYIQEVSCSYSDTFESIYFEFPFSAVNNSLTCEQIFAQSSINQFGLGYTCFFIEDNLKLVLNLGTSATFVYGEIDFQPMVLYSSTINCLYNPVPLKAILLSSGDEPETVANLESPEYVLYKCENLKLSGQNSQGAVKRKMLYKWTITSVPYNPKISSYSTDFQEKGKIFIAKSSLFTCKLTVILTVLNAFGSESVQKSEIDSVVFTDKLFIYYDPHIPHYFLPNIDNYFNFYAQKCDLVEGIEFNWKILSIEKNASFVDLDYLWNAQLHTGQLIIPSRTFVPYSEIVFECFVVNKNRTVLGQTQLKLISLPIYPQVVIDLANGTVSTNQDLFINVSYFFEFNLTQFFDLTWKCFEGGSDCIITSQNISQIFIDKTKLKAGETHILQLFYKDRILKQNSGILRSLLLKPYKRDSLIVNIYEKTTNLQPQIVNIGSFILLQSLVDYFDQNISYKWEIVSGSLSGLENVRNSGLFINTLSLSPGYYYKIKLEISVNGFKGEYFYEFTTNYPPVIEKLLVSPKIGTEFSSLFRIRAVNSYDPDFHYPLHYVFGYYINNQKIMMNFKNQSFEFWTQLPFTDGQTEVFVQVFDSLDSSSEMAEYILVKFNKEFNKEIFFEEMKKKFNSVYFDYQTTTGFVALLSAGVLNRQLMVESYFSKESKEGEKLLNDCYEFCLEALKSMFSNIPSITTQGLTALTTIIEMLGWNPNLQSINNTQNMLGLVKILLNQTESAHGIDKSNFENVVKGSFNEAPLNSSFVFNETEIFGDLIKYSLSAANEYSKQIIGMDPVYSDLINLESVISSAKPYNDEMLVLVSNKYNSKVEFSNELYQILNDTKAFVTMLTIPLADNSNFYSNSDPIRPYIVDVSLFTNFSYKPVESISYLLSIYIPIYNYSSDYKPQCIYLDSNTFEWSTEGCSLHTVINSTAVCNCSHMSSFSVTKLFESSGKPAEKGNFKESINLNLLKKLDSSNAAGLIFVLSITLIYFITALLLHKSDLKFKPYTLSTETFNKFEKNIKCESPAHNSLALDSERYDLQSQDNVNIEFHVPIKIRKSYISTFVENNKKKFSELIKENHELLRLIYKPDIFETRVILLGIFYIKVLLYVYLIGMFYKEKEIEGAKLEYASLKEGLAKYSAEDFWIMVYSIIISAFILKIMSYSLGYYRKHRRLYPFSLKIIPWKFKIRRLVGYTLGSAISIICGIGISLFSITFSSGTKRIWIVGSCVSLIFEIFIVSVIAESILIFFKKLFARILIKKLVS